MTGLRGVNTPQPATASLPADASVMSGHTHADQAFCEALGACSEALLAMATRLLGDPSEAQDAVQEAWLRAWTRRDQLRDEAALAGWLRQIVARECLRALRWRAVRRWIPFGQAMPDPAGQGPDLAAAMDAGTARAMIERLPPRQRQLWGLRFDEGWTLPEIALGTGLSQSTVKTHLERAMLTVRASLERPDV